MAGKKNLQDRVNSSFYFPEKNGLPLLGKPLYHHKATSILNRWVGESCYSEKNADAVEINVRADRNF